MGGMLPRPRKNAAFRGRSPQGQETTIAKAEKTTREQFRHHVVPFMAKFLGYYKISAQNLNLKELFFTKA